MNDKPSQQQLVAQLFRTEFSKITAVLCKLFGIRHVEVAEDIVSDTFLLATESWESKGLPDNPTAWLYTVAKNKAKDYFKRNALFTQKIATEIKHTADKLEEMDLDLSNENITDSTLQMMFAVCHPTIPPEAQIGLALRILCGFSIDEIAEAFLTNKASINKRLYRAKEKLRANKIQMELPPPNEIEQRLAAVLSTLYLLFNEGYYSATQNASLRKDLCLEAMRLNYLLLANSSTNLPPVNALMALFCFHASRFEARQHPTANDEWIPYEEQDTKLWNTELIDRGGYYLNQATSGTVISTYHLEAAIAYWHTIKPATTAEKKEKWESILQLYNQLLQINYSPIVALNRTYALAQTAGKTAAIKEAEKLPLTKNHFYYSLLGYLYTNVNNKKALLHWQSALALAKTPSDKNTIHKNIEDLEKKI